MTDFVVDRMAFVEAFEVLAATVGRLAGALRADAALPAVLAEAQGPDARQLAVEAYTTLHFKNGQDPKAVLFQPGIVGASRETVSAAQAVNAAKEAFKVARLSLQRHGRRQSETVIQGLPGRSKVLAKALEGARHNRLHIVQCDRKIVLLDNDVRRVGFTWPTRLRSLERIGVDQAREKLERMGEAPHIQRQLNVLAGLPAATPLALVRDKSPRPLANIYRLGQPRPQLIGASLPLLTLCEDGQLPEHNRPTLAPPERDRLVRSDEKVEPVALLPSIHVHRYRAG